MSAKTVKMRSGPILPTENALLFVFLAAAVQDCRRIAGYCDFVRLDLFVFPDDLRISGDRVKTQIGIRTAAVAVNFTVRIADTL